MRKLHLVGVTTDLKGLIFTARKGSKSGGYMVALDPKLLEAVGDADRRNNGSLPSGSAAPPAEAVAPPNSARAGAAANVADAADGRVQSALSPREMQARMRAGRSIEEVASEAGVSAEWVARFAVPILAEQAQVVALARGLTFAKPRLGPSALPLGEAVARNLAERGSSLPADLFDPAWNAYQLHDSVWTVRFRHELRGRPYEAQWELDVATGRLAARNRVASDLGYVDPGGRRRTDDEHGDSGADDDPAARPDDGGPRPAPTSTRGGARGAARQSGSRNPPAARPRSGAAPASRAGAKGRAKVAAPSPSPSPSRGRAGAGAGAKPKAKSGTSPGRTSRGTSGASSAANAPTSRRNAASDGGPTVRGGGIRAATAQVTSAKVAASRTLVARTVLPAPRPPMIRGGSLGGGLPGAVGSVGSGARRSEPGPGSRPERGATAPSETRYPGDTVPADQRRAPQESQAETRSRASVDSSSSDSLIDDLLRDGEPASASPRPARGQAIERVNSSSARQGGVTRIQDSPRSRSRRPPEQWDSDEGETESELPPFQPRTGPESSAAAPNVTRVRTGGTGGLVRATSNPGAGSKSGDSGSTGRNAGARKRASDGREAREPVRVPSVLSGASGPDRGMPAPRPRSRRLLRRGR